ncbi:MAG TPA: squalene synthase HpnC [Bacteroidota bacterium]|nr:squalene synthase HpnC [Bacteroidota bacterium]
MPVPLLNTKGTHWSSEDGFRYCEHLARTHYENFPVASRFVPKDLRKYVWAIYAFARTADDFADEPGYTLAERIDNLNGWEEQLFEAYDGNPSHRVFAALAETVERFQIPVELFQDLLAAFRSDISTHRYETFDDVVFYCSHSANPIGRLMLILFNYRSERLMELSDSLCTALQLTNFWQDISVDIKKNRIYIPQQDMEEFHYTEQDLLKGTFDDRFRNLLAFEMRRTMELFLASKPLLAMVKKPLSMELALTWHGGTQILEKIQNQNFNVFAQRPALSFINKAALLFRTISMYL